MPARDLASARASRRGARASGSGNDEEASAGGKRSKSLNNSSWVEDDAFFYDDDEQDLLNEGGAGQSGFGDASVVAAVCHVVQTTAIAFYDKATNTVKLSQGSDHGPDWCALFQAENCFLSRLTPSSLLLPRHPQKRRAFLTQALAHAAPDLVFCSSKQSDDFVDCLRDLCDSQSVAAASADADGAAPESGGATNSSSADEGGGGAGKTCLLAMEKASLFGYETAKQRVLSAVVETVPPELHGDANFMNHLVSSVSSRSSCCVSPLFFPAAAVLSVVAFCDAAQSLLQTTSTIRLFS